MGIGLWNGTGCFGTYQIGSTNMGPQVSILSVLDTKTYPFFFSVEIKVFEINFIL